LAQVIEQGLTEEAFADQPPDGSAVAEEFPAIGQVRFHCARHGRFLVGGKCPIVASVEIAFAYPNMLIANIVFNQARGNIFNITVAVAAPHEPWALQSLQFALPDTMVRRGVRFLAVEVHGNISSFMEHTRAFCRINVAAWKPYRISRYSWVASSSVIFALGPSAENRVLWHDCRAWEELPHGAAQLEVQSPDVVEATHGYGAVYPFPPERDLIWQSYVHQLLASTAQTIDDSIYSANHMASLGAVIQKAPRLTLPHTEKLCITYGSRKGNRSWHALIRRREDLAQRRAAKPWAYRGYAAT